MSFEAELVAYMRRRPDHVFVSHDEVWLEVPAGRRQLVDEKRVEVVCGFAASRVVSVPASARNVLGFVSPIVREALPTRGYTRCALGEHEAARDWRRRAASTGDASRRSPRRAA